MRILFAGLMLLHGAIHLMGFAKGFGLAALPALSQPISKPWGVAWLGAALLLLLTGVAVLLDVGGAWPLALPACLLSQVLIAAHWQDAKAGTWPNLVLLAFVVAAVGGELFDRTTARLVAQLAAGRQAVAASGHDHDPAELEGLPSPVRRYLRLVLPKARPLIESVELTHRGTFNTRESGAQWQPFTSQQWVSVRRPGFVWAGRIAIWPGVQVAVHDAYVGGEGILRPAVLGLVPLMDLRDRGGDLAAGEFMRFVAEAVWYPTALLPSQGVHWQAVNGHTARATLRDGALEVGLDFTFGGDGLVESVACPARGRMVDGQFQPTPWEGRFWHYEARDGVVIPLEGEAAWLLPGGRHPYWRGEITALRYAPRAHLKKSP